MVVKVVNIFLYENGKHCNCPKDDCTTSPNNNAGGPGQLYEFTDSSQTNCGDIPKNDARNIPGRDDQDIENEGYFLGEHGSNFNAAKSYCEEKGTTLALIKDGESQQKAAAACGKHTCWIGLVEHGGQDGTWKWLDGETLSYTNWNEGEPNNWQGTDEKNAMMNCCDEDVESPNGKWHDVSEGFESPRPLCGEGHGNNNDTQVLFCLL